jgi:hypothetical protein
MDTHYLHFILEGHNRGDTTVDTHYMRFILASPMGDNHGYKYGQPLFSFLSWHFP